MSGSDSESKKMITSSRRVFLLGSAAAMAELILWSLKQSRPVLATSQDPHQQVTVVRFSDDGQRLQKVRIPKVFKTEDEWRKQLTPAAFEIARHADTEIAYTGKYWNLHEKGLYRCVCCGNALFSSDTKFDSGTGWPSFWEPIAKENVRETNDDSLGMTRTAVSCSECDAHLGHVFDDGPHPTGLRYCMNSASLRFVARSAGQSSGK